MSYFESLQKKYEKAQLKLFCLEEVDSTNTFLKKRAGQETMLCVALRQTAGRGRLGRAWSSQGENVYASFYYPVSRQGDGALTLCVALAVADAVEAFGVKAGIKWPNDIYVGDKKLCGILCEGIYAGVQMRGVVIGAGINANQAQFEEALEETATSLQIELGEKIPLEEVVFAVKAHLDVRLARYFQEGFGVFREEYESRSYLQGKEVAAGEFSGRCVGISEEGGLLLQQGEKMKEIRFGEAVQKVRPILSKGKAK